MIIVFKTKEEGLKKVKQILYKNCNRQTVLFLSGGTTPEPLYRELGKGGKLKLGGAALVDERYSHFESEMNEIMIKNTGILKQSGKSKLIFFPIVQKGLSLVKTAEKYDKKVHFLFKKYHKRIAILGIGADGHIASLPPKNSALKVNNLRFVSFVKNFATEPKVPRISLNMNALSSMDLLIVLSFGENKKNGIKIALRDFFGSLTKKTILITDQVVN